MFDRVKHYLRRAARHARPAVAPLRPEDVSLVTQVRARRLTYLSEDKLAALVRTCRGLDEAGVPGAFVEAGCALGGSTIVLASVKGRERPLLVYDVFGMIPPPSSEDTPDVHRRYRTIVEGRSQGIDGDPYYGYEDDLLAMVQANLLEFGVDPDRDAVSLIKGLLQDTLPSEGAVAMAHIDVDWHDPVLTCLQRIFPRLAVGGCLILDDYHDWGGCRKATDSYLRGIVGQARVDEVAGSLRITRVS